jgi:uncharacterized protein YxeA
MIWREKRVLLTVLAVLLLANTVFFFTYRVQYVSRLEDLDAKQQQAKMRLDEARRARMNAEQQLAAYKKAQADLQMLYNDRWSTPMLRLTALIDEVKRLAAASHLQPPSYQFTSTETKSDVKTDTKGSIGTTTVGIAFAVQGSYEQVCRLINLLELSDQFVIIDGISLGSSGVAAEKTLTLNIRLKTLFRDPRVNVPLANRQL